GALAARRGDDSRPARCALSGGRQLEVRDGAEAPGPAPGERTGAPAERRGKLDLPGERRTRGPDRRRAEARGRPPQWQVDGAALDVSRRNRRADLEGEGPPAQPARRGAGREAPPADAQAIKETDDVLAVVDRLERAPSVAPGACG